MPSYEYKSIRHEKFTFRLLTLRKGTFGEPIRCHLLESRIPQNANDRDKERMDYIALSYTWGGQPKRAEIEMDKCTIFVTDNLFSALKRIRSEDEDLHLWIDAVCINQTDHAERSHQVAQMKNIYQEALEVFVWLGENTPETDAALEAMIEIQKIRLEVGGDWRRVAQDQIPHELYTSGDASKALPVRRGLDELLRRPWFRRIWILQEIASARAARIYCGKKFVSAHIFAQFTSLLGIRPDAHCQAILDIMPGFSRNESWWAEKRDLRTLLWKFNASGATDERDMIYALLGICEDACINNALKADYDYRTTIEKVIQRTVCFLLTHGQTDPSSYDFLDWNLKIFHQNLSHLEDAVFVEALAKGRDMIIGHLIDKVNMEFVLKTRYGSKLLQWAKENNHELPLQDLCETGRFLSVNNYGVVLRAIVEGHEHECNFSVSDSAIEVGLKDHAGRTLLSHAAEHGSIAATEVLHAMHETCGYIEADFLDNNGRTPLSYAAEHGHVVVVKFLLKHDHFGTDVQDHHSRTPLSYAAQHGHIDILKLLCARADVDPDSQDNVNRTPLSYAAENGNASMVEVLLAQDHVDADSSDNTGRTPLSYATQKGDLKSIEFLSNRGADIYSKDSNCLTPLLYAVKSGNVRLVELLTTRTVPSHPAESAYAALEKQCRDSTVDTNLRSAISEMLLFHAVKQGNIDLAKFLVSLPTQANSTDDVGRGPLSYAVEKGYGDIAELLINNGANVNPSDNVGRTPLFYAVKGELDIVLMLIKHGANVNALDKEGSSPLIHAFSAFNQYGAE